MAERHVAIIGGGFSGTALAIQLARHASTPLRITLLEPRDVPGLGIAYSTTEPTHRINVPASRMQLPDTEAGDFDQWYRQQQAFQEDIAACSQDGSLWPQRGHFGRYVNQRLKEAVHRPGIIFTHIHEQAVDLVEGTIITASGLQVVADLVVLAVSHPPPALPAPLAGLANHPSIVANPWKTARFDNIAVNDRVAIIGSGLTMADVVASLGSRGHRGGVIVFSRHGLLPQENLSGEYPDWLGEYKTKNISQVRQWLALVRRDIRLAAEQGIPWQKVLDEVRHYGQRIWQSLPLYEQQRFLRHLRSWWDVHRYRISPQVAHEIARRSQRGELEVWAARLDSVKSHSKQLQLFLQCRNGASKELLVDHLVVTTGPAYSSLTDSQPLLSKLFHRGIIQADPLGLGLLVNERSQIINCAAKVIPNLLVVGPAARGRFGELMGLPQVGDHARMVALEVLTSLSLGSSYSGHYFCRPY